MTGRKRGPVPVCGARARARARRLASYEVDLGFGCLAVISKLAIDCWRFIRRVWRQHDCASSVGSVYYYEEIILDDIGRRTLERLSGRRIVRRRFAVNRPLFFTGSLYESREIALDAPSGQTGYFGTAGDYLFVEGLSQEGETTAFLCVTHFLNRT